MSPTRTGIVRIGCIDVLDGPAAVAEQRRLNAMGHGFGARNRLHVRRYHEGEKIELPVGEFDRLQKLGIVALLPAK